MRRRRQIDIEIALQRPAQPGEISQVFAQSPEAVVQTDQVVNSFEEDRLRGKRGRTTEQDRLQDDPVAVGRSGNELRHRQRKLRAQVAIDTHFPPPHPGQANPGRSGRLLDHEAQAAGRRARAVGHPDPAHPSYGWLLEWQSHWLHVADSQRRVIQVLAQPGRQVGKREGPGPRRQHRSPTLAHTTRPPTPASADPSPQPCFTPAAPTSARRSSRAYPGRPVPARRRSGWPAASDTEAHPPALPANPADRVGSRPTGYVPSAPRLRSRATWPGCAASAASDFPHRTNPGLGRTAASAPSTDRSSAPSSLFPSPGAARRVARYGRALRMIWEATEYLKRRASARSEEPARGGRIRERVRHRLHSGDCKRRRRLGQSRHGIGYRRLNLCTRRADQAHSYSLTSWERPKVVRSSSLPPGSLSRGR